MSVFLRRIFSDILNGYTQIKYNEKTVFFKHLDTKIFGVASEFYEDQLAIAQKNGLKSKKEKEAEHKDELASLLKRQRELDVILDTNKISKDKEILPSRKKLIQQEIDKFELEKETLELEKRKITGLTAEEHASSIHNDFLSYILFFNDKDFKESFFGEASFDDIDKERFLELRSLFRIINEQLNDKNLKLIAASSFFLNLFILANDSVLEFYGQPITNLTQNQIDLFYLGRNYKSILGESNVPIPSSIRNDPEALVYWFENRSSAGNLLDQDVDGASLVNATAEDYELLGIAKPVQPINQLKDALDKAGGSLSMAEFIKMSGGG